MVEKVLQNMLLISNNYSTTFNITLYQFEDNNIHCINKKATSFFYKGSSPFNKKFNSKTEK